MMTTKKQSSTHARTSRYREQGKASGLGRETAEHLRRKRKVRTVGYRPFWHAEYKENGKTRQIRLTVKIEGVPPKSLSIKDEGSVLYEKSKARAQAEFEAFENERKRKGTSERLMEELTEKDVKGFLDWLKAQGSAHRYAVNGPKYTLFAYPFNHTYKIPMAMSTATRQPAQPSAISHICRDSK